MKTTNDEMQTSKRVIGGSKLKSNRFKVIPATGLSKKAAKEKARKAKTYKGKSTRSGGGGKFAKLKDKLMDEGKDEETARAISAKMGMRKYGKAKMMKWAAQGRKRAKGKE